MLLTSAISSYVEYRNSQYHILLILCTDRILYFVDKTSNHVTDMEVKPNGKSSLNELRLPWTNSAKILSQGTPLPSFTLIQNESHGKVVMVLAGQSN